MSNSDTAVTCTADGVVVRKTYEPDEFPVQVVSFEIRSERENPVSLRLVDPVPDAVAATDLGFNPNYGGDHWSTEDGDAVFERRIEPNEAFRTVYGVRDTDVDPAAFMTEPRLDVGGTGETKRAAATATDAGTGSPAEATPPGRDPGRAGRDAVTGDADSAESVDSSGTGDPADPTGTTGGSTTEPAPTGDGSGAALAERGVGAALAAELRAGDISEPDRELLADELTGKTAGNHVRLSHLQSRISDLEAYTDALEDFIDENGSARQLIAKMTERLDTVESDVEALDERTTANAAAIERLDNHAERNAQNVDALDKGIADTNSEVAETRDSLAELRTEVETIDDWRDRISDVLGGVSTADEGEN